MAVSQTKAPRAAVVTEAGEMTTVSRATAGGGPVEPAGRLGQPRGAAPERIIGLEEYFVIADVLDRLARARRPGRTEVQHRHRLAGPRPC
jgi:hypothetical protein